MTNKEQILNKAIEILKGEPHGLRYSRLVESIQAALPSIPRVRAAKHEPDMFYVNRCMKLIEDDLFV